MSLEQYRRQAEELLNQASAAPNMKERGRLIDEAMHWHRLALDAHDRAGRRLGDEDDGQGEALTGT